MSVIEQTDRSEAIERLRSHRPWGYYDVVDIRQRFQVKRLVVVPGGTLSLQKHLHRAEHWVVVGGTAEVTIGKTKKIVHENESAYIPMGAVHRLANPGKIPLELIEKQTGSYFGEDDIIRPDDVYQRVPAEEATQTDLPSGTAAAAATNGQAGAPVRFDSGRGRSATNPNAPCATP